MPRAFVLIRQQPVYRREAFVNGLKRCGYEIHNDVGGPVYPTDVLVIWNRYGHWDHIAKRFRHVLVAENGYLGRDWRGEHWYALARDYHNGAGTWPDGGPERWDSFGVDLAPWRESGDEIVMLATRNIGPHGVAEPHGWSTRVAREKGARIRRHPGENACIPLVDDLARAKCVLTWGSGGALKALTMGIPVQYGFKRWIGAQGASPLGGSGRGDRLAMFRRLAWAMWRTDEIETGEPFQWLMSPSIASATTTVPA